MLTEITYDVQGRSFTGYLARETSSKSTPGVLVLHGGGGLGPQAKERAEMLAKSGYVAFVPDMFGEKISGVDHAHAIVKQYTDDWALLRARCNAGLEVLCNQPGVDAKRTAAIGFCFGGQAALELARSGVALGAVVGFHSQLDTRRPQDSAHIKGKVLICLGDQDCFVFREHRDAFMENMTASKVDCQLMLMSGVGHSFSDPHADKANLPGIKYNASADRRTWAAMHALFAEAFEN
jgi:dienelactone hydrolase